MVAVHRLPIWIFNKKFRLEERTWRVIAQKEERISIILILYANLNVRAVQKPEGIEEVVLKKIQAETLHTAMKKLPEMQRRRMQMYYFEDMTYEQIARKEGCTKMPVKRSIEAGIERLKKELKKI